MAKPHIPLPPTHHPPTHLPGSGSNSGDAPTDPGTGNGSGGGGKDPYAQARADQKKRDARAAKSHLEIAKQLQEQIDAYRDSLSKDGFRNALEIKIANVEKVLTQQDKQILKGYHERVDTLKGARDDNDKSTDAQSYANLSNRGRERMNATSEAMNMGAGESDLLAAQGASLRNWNANQSEISRSYYDTLRSVNSSLTDLNVDTRTARQNIKLDALADKDSLWTNYYDQRSEAYTQLGNKLGEQAAEYTSANELKKSKKSRKLEKEATKLSGKAFDNAAELSGKAWENPGLPKELREWSGHHDFEAELNGSTLSTGHPVVNDKKPEGASLRSW